LASPQEPGMKKSRAGHLLLSLFAVGAWLLLYGLAAAPAWAHFREVGEGGWSDGFAHPFSGIDHILCMVAVGIWAVQIGRHALWLLPASFTVLMAGGAVLGGVGIVLPGADDGVALSVTVLGVLLAVAARPRLLTGGAVVAGFGLVHGYVHGVEMPATAQPLLYALGFVVATLVLQLTGIAFGLAAQSPLGQRLLPIGAAAVAGLGVTLLLAL
jgi:urease accessory protein